VNPNDAVELLTRLLHRIAPEVNLANVDPDALLQEEMDLDSMDFLNLVTAVHDDAGIDIPESDYPKLATLGGFTAYLSGATAGTAAPTAS
jgi:acyl carrier protein